MSVVGLEPTYYFMSRTFVYDLFHSGCTPVLLHFATHSLTGKVGFKPTKFVAACTYSLPHNRHYPKPVACVISPASCPDAFSQAVTSIYSPAVYQRSYSRSGLTFWCCTTCESYRRWEVLSLNSIWFPNQKYNHYRNPIYLQALAQILVKQE